MAPGSGAARTAIGEGKGRRRNSRPETDEGQPGERHGQDRAEAPDRSASPKTLDRWQGAPGRGGFRGPEAGAGAQNEENGGDGDAGAQERRSERRRRGFRLALSSGV